MHINTQYVPLLVRSDFSLLQSPSKIDQIVSMVKKLGLSACALTDSNSVSGIPEFLDTCKKNEVFPIVGTQVNLCFYPPDDKSINNDYLSSIVLLAKNHEGYKTLLKIISESHRPEYYRFVPRLNMDILSRYIDGNIIAIDGYLGSYLSHCIFSKKEIDQGQVISSKEKLESILDK